MNYVELYNVGLFTFCFYELYIFLYGINLIKYHDIINNGNGIDESLISIILTDTNEVWFNYYLKSIEVKIL